MQNTVESQYVARLLFRDWVPQAFIDHHQMGWRTRPASICRRTPNRFGREGDPLVWREMSWYGAHMAYRDGRREPGIGADRTSAIYSGWGHFGFHWITPFHNIAGMLTESASATPGDPALRPPRTARGVDGSSPSTRPRPRSPAPGPAAGGVCGISSSGRSIAYIRATLDIAAQEPGNRAPERLPNKAANVRPSADAEGRRGRLHHPGRLSTTRSP